ncbi:UvrD-helicase domain-containing protein [Candidatus Cloacimonadota bacterium]
MNETLVIRASAGTGKTYRLSLEFINLLLKYRTSFEEILVITFTRKATAEIRERIFSQLKVILEDNEDSCDLRRTFREKINPEIEFNSEEMGFLRETYARMITAKSKVKISTIDSFVNNVFTGIIAPFNNIQEFSIDNKINQEILPEIFERILQPDRLEHYKDIFLKSKSRNLDQFRDFVLEIIENRWLFNFIDPSQLQELDLESHQEAAKNSFSELVMEFLHVLQDEINKKDKPVSDLLQKDFLKVTLNHLKLSELENADLENELFTAFMDEEFLQDNFSLLLSKNPWHGNRIRSNTLKEIYPQVQSSLSEFLYYDKAVIEQLEIITLASNILQVYDEIKFRDRIFTHSDISYYTFRYLYDPELSLIDKNNVMNLFYEQLSYNIRFILIDEFQDTSILQWSIIKPVLKELISGEGQKEHSSIIIVGDEKQAIYGWRGGERKLLTDFSTLIGSDILNDNLTTSYRSKPVLMHWLNRCFSSNLLDYSRNWQYSSIDTFKRTGGYVQLDLKNGDQFGDNPEKLPKYEIYKEFVDRILLKNLSKGSIDPKDTAILMRTNSELQEMARVLDEAGIDYVYETSGSLFQHKAVQPLLDVISFLVYDDLYSLIEFLRSDIILMYPDKIRDLIKEYKACDSINEFLDQNISYPFLKTLAKLRSTSLSVLQTVKILIEESNSVQIFCTEIDLRNLLRFLEIAAEFERKNHDYTVDLSGFLSYCRAIADKEEYSQIGQAISDSIRLLTIHKSKGLQFETVFAIFNISSSLGRSGSGFKFYYDFSDDFSSLQDFAITLNYDKVMQLSHKRELTDKVKTREFEDELNNIYVALTRAQNNLFLYMHYYKKGYINKFFNDITSESSLLKNFSKHLYSEFSEEINEISPTLLSCSWGEISKESTKKQEIKDHTPCFENKFRIFDPGLALEIPKKDFHKLRSEIINNRSIQVGNVVHEYLSHIEFDSPKARKIAYYRTLSKYGTLFTANDIDLIAEKAELFIDLNRYLFSKECWDKVFNEFSIFNNAGNEFRIDRLLINEADKQILIIDYKTGIYHKQEQLDRYKEIIKKIPIVKHSGYKVNSEFKEILINRRNNE